MARTELCNVFVYGTLKPDYINFERLCSGKVCAVSPALVKGQLYQIPFYSDKYPRGYPAVTLEKGWVEGYLLQFENEAILEQLDLLEGYQEGRSPQENDYQRQRLQIFTLQEEPLVEAWVYVMTQLQIKAAQGILLNKTVW